MAWGLGRILSMWTDSLPRPSSCPRLHDKIMEVGGSRVQSQQSKVDQLSSEMDTCTVAVTKANVAIKTSERCVICSVACVCVEGCVISVCMGG